MPTTITSPGISFSSRLPRLLFTSSLLVAPMSPAEPAATAANTSSPSPASKLVKDLSFSRYVSVSEYVTPRVRGHVPSSNFAAHR